MIPWSAFVCIEWARFHRKRRFSLWIPLFLIWLLLLPLVLILFPVVAIACLVLRINLLRLYTTAWGIVTGLRHTRVEVRTPTVKILVNVT